MPTRQSQRIPTDNHKRAFLTSVGNQPLGRPLLISRVREADWRDSAVDGYDTVTDGDHDHRHVGTYLERRCLLRCLSAVIIICCGCGVVVLVLRGRG